MDLPLLIGGFFAGVIFVLFILWFYRKSPKAALMTFKFVLILAMLGGVSVLGKTGYEWYQKEQVAKQGNELNDTIDDILEQEDILASNPLPETTSEEEEVVEEETAVPEEVQEETEDALPEIEKPMSVSEKVIQAANEKYGTSDFAGVLEIGDGVIREPFMIDPDQYYLRHLPDGTWAWAGTVFTWGDQLDPNKSCAVYYGHGMRNRSRFGPLLDYKKNLDQLKTGRIYTKESGVRPMELVQFSVINLRDFEYERLTSYEDVLHFMDTVRTKDNVFWESAEALTENDFIASLATCATSDASYRIVAIYKEVK